MYISLFLGHWVQVLVKGKALGTVVFVVLIDPVLVLQGSKIGDAHAIHILCELSVVDCSLGRVDVFVLGFGICL